MEDTELDELAEIEYRKAVVHTEKVKRIAKLEVVSYMLTPPTEKGYFRKHYYCPKCNDTLFPERVTGYQWFSCKCGYEYARIDW